MKVEFVLGMGIWVLCMNGFGIIGVSMWSLWCGGGPMRCICVCLCIFIMVLLIIGNLYRFWGSFLCFFEGLSGVFFEKFFILVK